MTVIAGAVYKNKVFIGCDSAGSSGWDLVVRSDPKIFRNGPFLIGYTSSFRMGQLLRFSFVPPTRAPKISDYHFMCTAFINSVRECLKAGGFANKKEEVEAGGEFLVAYRGKLYSVHSDYQVGVSSNGFHAVGCGAQIALGAMHVLPKANPRLRVLKSLHAAERHSAGVRGPFRIMEL